MTYCGDKDIDAILVGLVRLGWRVDYSTGRHLKVYPPGGRRMVVVSRTPSDYHVTRNIIGDLRRAGAPIKGVKLCAS